ncbi:Bestrophin, RFP-TM, chloride channel-domain-containing protein [Mycena amicta]|nr:Bestrophin, RFP-TM, chloride channel-domain-containing protein [Mycena amicta]
MDSESTLGQSAETLTHKGFAAATDATASRRRPGNSFVNALLATAFFRCWHILLFFAVWSTCITVLDDHRFKVRVPMLTVYVGTVLGFIISYRTTSSFERYNEGRRLWSQIILASRTFSRTVWFHIPDQAPTTGNNADGMKAREMVKKKTVINLVEAFGVAVKHYLRGEDGIYYRDLYYLVKFLPAYAFPQGISSNADPINGVDGEGNLRSDPSDASVRPPLPNSPGSFLYQRTSPTSSIFMSTLHLPLPVSTIDRRTSGAQIQTGAGAGARPQPPPLILSLPTRMNLLHELKETQFTDLGRVTNVQSARSPIRGEPSKFILARADEALLMPGHMPPKYHLFDLFPFSLLVKCLTRRSREIESERAARIRAKILREKEKACNLPLEISFYLSSYIAALQSRKQIDVPTTNTLLASLNQLVDALTGLERISTTPVPYSYSVHLWVVVTLYCLALPSQIVATMRWLTIPATIILAFIFFGFLVAGEEIENPFGYDKNHLHLDHFTQNIIRSELRALTSAPAPDPERWVFAPENDLLFTADVEQDERVGPEMWVHRGSGAMLGALGVV